MHGIEALRPGKDVPMPYGNFSLRSLARVSVGLPVAVGLLMTLTHCAEVLVGDKPIVVPEEVRKEYCIQGEQALLLSDVLSGAQALTSDISASDCSDANGGHFETWHVFADQTETVIVVAESDFDNLMRLVQLEDIKQTPDGYDVEVRIVAENDDQGKNDSRARVAATLEEGKDYLLILSGFNEDETGPYDLETSPTPSLPPPPATGSINVNVASTGESPDSYTVTLGGAKAKAVPANGTATYVQIITGQYAVELSVPGNCTVVGANPETTIVGVDQSATANFSVECSECITADDCLQGGECTVTVCAEGGVCGTQTAEDGTGCEYNAGAGQCTGGTCGPTTCPPCVDDEPTDCMEPFCPVGSTACSARPRPLDSDCATSGEDGKCDSSGNCVECNVPSQCTEDGNACTAPSCINHQCGQSNVPDGTACSGGAGSCQAGVCESLTGTIEVAATLSAVGNGGDKGYTVLIDSVSRGTIGPGTPVSYGGFTVGSHNVLLQGIDGDCYVTDTDLQTVNVTAGGTAVASFEVRCDPVAPQLLDIDHQLITLDECGLPGSTFRYSVDYYDGDGDVTPSGTRVFVDIVWSAGGTQSYESDGAFNSVTGNGFTGAVQAYNCLEHGSSSYADVTVTIWDASGRASNPQTTRVPRP